jgi:hypothetical protein
LVQGDSAIAASRNPLGKTLYRKGSLSRTEVGGRLLRAGVDVVFVATVGTQPEVGPSLLLVYVDVSRSIEGKLGRRRGSVSERSKGRRRGMVNRVRRATSVTTCVRGSGRGFADGSRFGSSFVIPFVLTFLVTGVQLDHELFESSEVEVFVFDFGEVVLDAGRKSSTEFGSEGRGVPIQVVGVGVKLRDVGYEGVGTLHKQSANPLLRTMSSVDFAEVLLEDLAEKTPVVEPIGFDVLD